MIFTNQFTRNFKVDEFISKTDYVDSTTITNIWNLANLMQELRDALNCQIRITSAYRDPLHNARVGGSSNSHHLTGSAADFQLMWNNGVIPFSRDHLQTILAVVAEQHHVIELIAERNNSNWIHIAISSNPCILTYKYGTPGRIFKCESNSWVILADKLFG